MKGALFFFKKRAIFIRLLRYTSAISSPVIWPLGSVNIRTYASMTACFSTAFFRIALSFVSTTQPLAPTSTSHSSPFAFSGKCSSCSSTFQPAARNFAPRARPSERSTKKVDCSRSDSAFVADGFFDVSFAASIVLGQQLERIARGVSLHDDGRGDYRSGNARLSEANGG